MPTVHLMYGLAGSGKTTHARHLQATRRALRFTLDEWMIRLYPGLSIEDSEYGVRAERVRDVIWDVTEQALRMGVEAVPDWNFWSADRRRWAVQRARHVGADVELHWLPAPQDAATARAQRRTVGHFHEITPEGNAHLARLMEPPRESEGLTITRV